jgi:hypothetical protein
MSHCVEDAAVILSMHAYVHRSAGRPGEDSGSGWMQFLKLRISNAGTTGRIPSLPATIAEGGLRIGDEARENFMPTTGIFSKPVELYLVFANSETLTVAGSASEILQ